MGGLVSGGCGFWLLLLTALCLPVLFDFSCFLVFLFVFLTLFIDKYFSPS